MVEGIRAVTTFLEAAARVLQGKGSPMSAKDIAAEAISGGFITTKGKTPAATMAASIYVDIDRKGPGSPFVKQGRGRFGLREWGRVRPETTVVETPQTFRSAAIRVLSEARKPLDVRSITERALRAGFLQTKGKTPSATMGAQLYVDVARRSGNSPFVQLGKSVFGLREWDIDVLKPQIAREEKEERTTKLAGIMRRSIVGDPINVEGLTYGPLNENGVIFLFSKVQDKLPRPITIEAIQPAFPDAKGRRKTEKGWVDIWIEFEYKSSHFKLHKHPPAECDIIVCWEHDWKGCPIEVIELKSVLSNLGLSRNPPSR
jgi:hypothetical protein